MVYKALYKRFRMRLGFLTSGYKDEFYYWEIVLLLRKTAFVLFIIFMVPVSSGIQALLSCLLLISYSILQIFTDPYYDEKLNTLESISLYTQIMTVYLGLFFLTNKDSTSLSGEWFKWLIFSLILIPTWAFILYFISKMRHEALVSASTMKNGLLWKICSCGLIKNKKDFIRLRSRIRKLDDSDSGSNEDQDDL